MRRDALDSVRLGTGRRVVSLATIALVLMVAGEGRGLGAEPERTGALGRYLPGEGLVAFAEFDGLDAHGALWRNSTAYRLLTESATGAMLDDIVTQLFGRFSSAQPLSADEMRTVVLHLARSGFAVGVVMKPGENQPRCVGLVLRGAARGKVRAAIDKLLVAARIPGVPVRPIDGPGGRKLMVEGKNTASGFAWWVEKDDLAFSLSSAAGADFMLDALDGRTADASKSLPRDSAPAGGDDDFVAVGRAFLDVSALPNLRPTLAPYGLDRIKRATCRWGFQREALMTATRLDAPAPRAGVLAVFDQKTFDRDHLPALPPGLVGVTAFSLNLAEFYERISSGIAASDPSTRDALEKFETAVRDLTGHRLRDDLLPRLGPRVTFYDVPTPIDAPANGLVGLAQGLFRSPAFVAVIEVKDARAFARVLDDTMTALQKSFQSRAEATSHPPLVRVQAVKGVDHGYSLSIAPTVAPLPAGLKPTFLLGEQALIVGSAPDAARAALALQQRGGALPAEDRLAGPLGRLPRRLIFAHVNDARRSLLPEIVANLPGLIQWGGDLRSLGVMRQFVGMPDGRVFQLRLDPDHAPAPGDLRPFLSPSVFTLTSDETGIEFRSRESFPAFNPIALAPVAAALILPVAHSVRSSARRTQSVNNLKQIGLAMHNLHSVNNHFPPQAIADKDGKPLLSWRVAILPYIEQAALYNEFKLDEPWDSPHNKALIPRMPATLLVPDSNAEPGKTFYRGFSGEHAFFDPKLKAGLEITGITDGTSNTIAIVEAREAVIWSKPDEELPFDAAAPPEKDRDLKALLGGHSPGGFNALFVDGSVRFIKESINPKVLKALITRAGGEVISADSY